VAPRLYLIVTGSSRRSGVPLSSGQPPIFSAGPRTPLRPTRFARDPSPPGPHTPSCFSPVYRCLPVARSVQLIPAPTPPSPTIIPVSDPLQPPALYLILPSASFHVQPGTTYSRFRLHYSPPGVLWNIQPDTPRARLRLIRTRLRLPRPRTCADYSLKLLYHTLRFQFSACEAAQAHSYLPTVFVVS